MAGNEHKADDRRGPYRLTGEERERVRAMQQRFREELHGTSRRSRLALLRSLATDVTKTAGQRIVSYLAPNTPRGDESE
jgi:hypothetical protein